jgi:RluA family pseudouridine synthase
MKTRFVAQRTGRLDRVLRESFPAWGRKVVDEVIGTRKVSINGRKVWMSSWQVELGDELSIENPPEPEQQKKVVSSAFDPRWLIHQSADLVVMNKPEGLRIEPTRAEDKTANLLDIVQQRFGYVTLAHRLDRDTSGLVLFARTRAMRQALDIAFKDHTIEKRYVAIVRAQNNLDEEGVISFPLKRDPQRRDQMVVAHSGGDPARTKYRVIEERNGGVVVHLWPLTGRTHQLRVHLATLNAPILGDRLYGDEPSADRLMLHAEELVLPRLASEPPQKLTTAAPF